MSYFELMGFGPKGWGWPMLLAAGMTVAVASCGFLAGSALGSLIAWAKLSRSRVLRALGDGYTTVLRCVPDLLVIYLFYFGGSAVLSTQMAIEQLPDGAGRVILSNAPFVEGAVIAAVEASIESDLDGVAAAALGAREMEKVSS